jgi:hypothetical protein
VTTSSSEPAAPPIHHLLAAAGVRAAGIRTPLPTRVRDLAPPQPPPPPPPVIDTAPLARALDAGFRAVASQVDAALGDLSKEVLLLSLAAAETLARRRCEAGELGLAEPLEALIAARRRELTTRSARLRAHPADAALIEPLLPKVVPAGAEVALLADPAMPRGQMALELGVARVIWSLAQDAAALRERIAGGGSGS